MASNTPRIGLGFNPNDPWVARVLVGLRQYIDEHEPWELLFTIYDRDLISMQGSRRYVLDGVITSATSKPTASPANAPPTVCITEFDLEPEGVGVLTDMDAVGRTAAEHLIQRGLRTLAVLSHGNPTHRSASLRTEGFKTAAAEAGLDTAVFRKGPRTLNKGKWQLADQIADFSEFMYQLPKPIGLMAYDALHAWRAMIACNEAGLRLPDDVAMICGGDNEVVFESTRPTITGILYDSHLLGYRAAETLDRMMRGEAVPQRTLIPPIGVIERESTNFLAVTDPEVERIIRYIWQHVDEQVRVEDLLYEFPISARTLTRRFQKAVGHAPADEIRRSRVETAKRLLLNSDKPLAMVAVESGLGTASQLTRSIRQATGQTPSTLRKQHRSR